MAITLVQSDFQDIGQLAQHCDQEKLEIAINEAIIFDLERLLCYFFTDVDDNWDSEVELWTDIIAPKAFTGCDDKPTRHMGLKRVLLYYAYARYVVLNGFNDTPNGHVSKTNPFSIPKTLKELEQFADKYREMGYGAWLGVKNFLCLNRADYVNFDDSDCGECGCGSCDKTLRKGYGLRSSNITK